MYTIFRICTTDGDGKNNWYMIYHIKKKMLRESLESNGAGKQTDFRLSPYCLRNTTIILLHHLLYGTSRYCRHCVIRIWIGMIHLKMIYCRDGHLIWVFREHHCSEMLQTIKPWQRKTYELYHFSDASYSGYWQCSYTRMIYKINEIHCGLVMATVTPIHILTIPRLGMIAPVRLVKIGNILRDELILDSQ